MILELSGKTNSLELLHDALNSQIILIMQDDQKMFVDHIAQKHLHPQRYAVHSHDFVTVAFQTYISLFNQL